MSQIIPDTKEDALGRLLFWNLVGRGNLKQVGIYLFVLINKLLVNLLGIPFGMQRSLDPNGGAF